MFLVLLCVFLATPAYAYIDPNTQGLITQSLTPLFVIASTVLIFFRDKAMSAFHWLSRCLGRRTDGAAE
jgi:hypothetical protein